MMFPPPKARRRSEPALPMINVVFLLLIFFLMSAQIVPPAPFPVAAPEANVLSAPNEEMALFVSADGEIALGGQVGQDLGQEPWVALAGMKAPSTTPLLIRADAALPARELARLLTRLAALGFGDIDLAVARK